LVFKSAQYGNVLVLDGVIQLTERDEFAYHEMMVHVPLCTHIAHCQSSRGAPRSQLPLDVLIVGGGDGCALREVLKYDSSIVRKITIVEIDPVVVHVSKTYFASILHHSSGSGSVFDDPRVELVHADAADYLEQQASNIHVTGGLYDIVVGDMLDPACGPAISLFEPSFYEAVYTVLRPNGIICIQAECFWIHLELISDLIHCCNEIFHPETHNGNSHHKKNAVEYATTMVPTYPCGQIGFLLTRKPASDPAEQTDGPLSCRHPFYRPNFLKTLKWYSPEMHKSAFTLPPFVLQQLGLHQQAPQQLLNGNGAHQMDDASTGSDVYKFGDAAAERLFTDLVDDEGDDEDDYRCFLDSLGECTIL